MYVGASKLIFGGGCVWAVNGKLYVCKYYMLNCVGIDSCFAEAIMKSHSLWRRLSKN